MNANLPKLTRRNIKSNQLAFGTPWQPDYPVYSLPLPSRKNWGDLSLSPRFFLRGGGVCTQATTGFITLIYVISMEFLSLRRRRSSCMLWCLINNANCIAKKSLLIKQTENLISLSYFTRNADSMIKDFFPSFLFEMTAIRFWKSLNRWWRITLQCKLAHWCNRCHRWNKMKG